MEVEPEVLCEANADDADSLVSRNDADDMANEQTWPTEEEMKGGLHGSALGEDIPDAKKGTTPKVVRRLPKGTSEYQAAWIVDESDEEDVDAADDGSEEMEEAEEEMEDMTMEDGADMETESRRSVAFEDLDIEEEDRQ